MEAQLLILFFSGILIGVYSVVIGGGMFFSLPLFQWLFPTVSFGAIIGNLKVASFFRSIGSTASTYKKINFLLCFKVSGVALITTVCGAYTISSISQSWILPAVVIAVLMAILAPKIADKVSDKSFHLTTAITGFYAGVFGAGLGILLIALVRLKYTQDSDIALVKIQARFIEWILVITAVSVHLFAGNLIFDIWFPYAIGALIGGYLGGIGLKNLGKLSGRIQKSVLYTSFIIAIAIAAYKAL